MVRLKGEEEVVVTIDVALKIPLLKFKVNERNIEVKTIPSQCVYKSY